MTTFYKEVIGFQVLAQQENQTLLTADGETALLVLEEDPTWMIKPARTTGLYHFAILLPERADLARALLHLADVRYPLQGTSDHMVSEAVYLGNPEGNGIEIYVDRPREQWEGRVGELMGTEPLAIEETLTRLESHGQAWKREDGVTIVEDSVGHEIELRVEPLRAV